jgi:hypothetical protein
VESQSDSAQSHTSHALGVSEARRRETAMTQLSHRRLFQARPSILDPSGLDILARGPIESQFRRREYTYAARGDDRNLPVQTAVNRTDHLETETIDIEIREDGKVVEILRFPVFGRYGRDPNDAAWFSDSVDPRTAIYSVLAPYATIRCLARGGAW